MTDFLNLRRQQFLQENYYHKMAASYAQSEEFWSENKPESDDSDQAIVLAQLYTVNDLFKLFILNYTAGIDLNTLRYQLENLINHYGKYTSILREYEKKIGNSEAENESPLSFHDLEQFEKSLQLVGLCYLLHRRDLLLPLSKMIDPAFLGWDVVYEELLDYELEGRYDTEEIQFYEPYHYLIETMYGDTEEEREDSLKKYLLNWYPSMKQVSWYASHEQIDEDVGDYVGYWAFEAGAVSFLTELDDANIDHMVYPKDLVKFAREFVPFENDISNPSTKTLRCEAGQICPKTGEWYSPANNMEKRHFNQGDVMPEIKDNPWGLTIWYMTE